MTCLGGAPDQMPEAQQCSGVSPSRHYDVRCMLPAGHDGDHEAWQANNEGGGTTWSWPWDVLHEGAPEPDADTVYADTYRFVRTQGGLWESGGQLLEWSQVLAQHGPVHVPRR